MIDINMVAEWRGGLPEKCDFCEQEYDHNRYPIPEEAGAWACSECYKNWYGEDNS